MFDVFAVEWEEMSIVAVSEKVAKALNTQQCQQLLTDLGFLPPSGQVRTYIYLEALNTHFKTALP